MSEFKPVIYRCFADFFDREFRPGVRTFLASPDQMAAFAEARYFGWETVSRDQQFPVKGVSLSIPQILGGAGNAAPFTSGPVLLARLSPMDYHHVHYPDDGNTLNTLRLGRSLWTVQWRALLNQPDILFRNERQIDILETEHFGKLAFVEVGAMSVGRIVQVHPLSIPFQRGEEKSVFKFGGSAIVVFGEAGKWRPTEDILEHTTEGMETLVRLGDAVALA